MRALLLLVLGAGLVWFVWRGLGSGRPAEDEAQASSPGAMIAMEAPSKGADAPSGSKLAEEPPAVSTPEIPAVAAPTVTQEPPAAVPAAPSPAVAGDHVADTGGANTTAAETAAAEALLREPAALGSWLASRGVDLPPARREFAAALVHAFAARESDALGALDHSGPTGQVQYAERELVRRIAARESSTAPIVADSPLSRAASMKDQERIALDHLGAGRAREAAEIYSRLLLAEIESPWRTNAERLASWSERLREAQRGNRWNRRGNWRSLEVVVQPGDSLISIRKRVVANDPSLVVCTGQIARANQLEGETIHPGAKLRIPLDRASVLVDLDAHWAFYMAGEEVVAAWPVGVGKEGSTTRTGAFHVGEKIKEPMWFPQGRKPVPFGDPENPLGTRWIKWVDADGSTTHLGFHGTNEPGSIGHDASLGCIRMRTEDVEELYEILPVGAEIRVHP